MVLPKIYNGRSKTFFFGSLGLFFSRQGSGGGIATIPTTAERQGDFSQLGVPIYDPATSVSDGKGGMIRQQFPNNQIPASRITQAAQIINSYIPSPTFAGINNNYINQAAANWPYLQ